MICEQDCVFQNNSGCWFACRQKIRAEAIDEFADMIKEFVINNGTIPNHTNVELLKIKIKELKEQK